MISPLTIGITSTDSLFLNLYIAGSYTIPVTPNKISVVYLIFSSGRCVITGSKTHEEAQQAEDMLRETLLPFIEGLSDEGF